MSASNSIKTKINHINLDGLILRKSASLYKNSENLHLDIS